MFKIGEFSKLVRVSARMLRHYDKCRIFCPAAIDRFTGYRLYSAEQIPLLKRIIILRDMGFGIEEIEEILPHYEDLSFMQKALEQKSKHINTVIIKEQKKLDEIAAMSDKIRKMEEKRMIYNVEMKALPAVKVLSLREIVSAPENEPEQWEKMWGFVKSEGVDCNATGYSIYHDEEYKESDIDIEIAVPVSVMGESQSGFSYRTLDAIPLAATIQFSGSYENYSAAMEKLAMWVQQNGYVFSGLIRGLGIVMPGAGIDIKDYLTELQVPVRKV